MNYLHLQFENAATHVIELSETAQVLSQMLCYVVVWKINFKFRENFPIIQYI